MPNTEQLYRRCNTKECPSDYHEPSHQGDTPLCAVSWDNSATPHSVNPNDICRYKHPAKSLADELPLVLKMVVEGTPDMIWPKDYTPPARKRRK